MMFSGFDTAMFGDGHIESESPSGGMDIDALDATTGARRSDEGAEVLHISARRAQDVQELVKKEEEEEAEMAEMEEGSYE